MLMKRTPLIILFFTIFLDLLGFGLVLPLLPVYVKSYGGTPWIGGMLMTSFSVTQFLFTPFWGKLSDRVGRRPLILISLIGSAISYGFFGAAPNLTVLFIARVASGILTSASIPTAQAYIADITPPDKRSGGMALIGAAFGLGFALGPMFSGILSQYPVLGITPLAMPAYAAALLCGINFIFAFFLLPETNAHRQLDSKPSFTDALTVFPTMGRALKHVVTGPPLLVFTFATFAFTAVESSFSWLVLLRFQRLIEVQATKAASLTHAGIPFAELSEATRMEFITKAQTATTTLLFTIVGITIILTQIVVMSGLARRVGNRPMIYSGALILTLALLGIAFSPNLNLIYVLSAFIAIGNGIMNPSLTALITETAGPKNRGEISGVQQGLGSLARIIAPSINNRLVEVWTGIPFIISAILMAISFGLSLRLGKPEEKPNAEAKPQIGEVAEDG